MNIYVINKSTVVNDDEILSWMPALNKFVDHVRIYWPRPVKLVWCPASKEPTLAWKLIFADTSDEAGALGYHDFTPDNRPISYIFAADDLKYGYSPTVTASHEIAEMIADPWISELFQTSNTEFYAKEICDPCEADEFGYTISIPGFPNVLVSDFVLPNWFIPGASAHYDFRNHISNPLEILRGGYMSVFISGQGWHQIYEQSVTKNMYDSKEKLGFGRLERYARDRGPARLS
jgi:hypothetical protein